MEEEIKIQKLIGVKDLFRNSWNIYKKDFRKFLIIAVIFFGITGLTMTFIGPEIPEIPEAKVQSAPPPFYTPIETEPLLTLPWYFFSFIILVTTFISILGSASLISAVKEVPKNWKIKDALKEGWFKYWPFLLVSLLTGLVIGLGFLLFIVPGIIFVIWLAFSAYTVICEDKKGFKALSRSRELVKGHWWATAKRVLAIMIITFPLSLGAQSIPYLGQLAFTILFTPFSIIYYYLIYQNLREIKD
ncbi:MAG: hypothetical protein E3J36_00300 [Candidatus Nealsonbacteria bacterium]|nr:MAG: hypothetical protein E3J36_00300 [Candidatus Nealsonbacteria bacterium]